MAVVPGAGGNDAVLALVIPSDDNLTTAGTRERVAAAWQSWPSRAPPPAPSTVCELPVRESSTATSLADAVAPQTGAHNGVMVEGDKAAELLRVARDDGDTRRRGTRTHALLRPLLRVFTRSELLAHAAAQQKRHAMLVALCAGVACAGILVGTVRMLTRAVPPAA